MDFEDCAGKFRECTACSLKPLPNAAVEKIINSAAHLEDLG
jgi:hypothetical protein